MSRRLLITIILIPAILFLPYWLYVPALILAMAAFPFYWESVLLGFVIDALYGERLSSFASLIYSAAFLTTIGLVILMPLRRRLRSHV